jgi:hypothetical protein
MSQISIFAPQSGPISRSLVALSMCCQTTKWAVLDDERLTSHVSGVPALSSPASQHILIMGGKVYAAYLAHGRGELRPREAQEVHSASPSLQRARQDGRMS